MEQLFPQDVWHVGDIRREVVEGWGERESVQMKRVTQGQEQKRLAAPRWIRSWLEAQTDKKKENHKYKKITVV